MGLHAFSAQCKGRVYKVTTKECSMYLLCNGLHTHTHTPQSHPFRSHPLGHDVECNSTLTFIFSSHTYTHTHTHTHTLYSPTFLKASLSSSISSALSFPGMVAPGGGEQTRGFSFTFNNVIQPQRHKGFAARSRKESSN